MKSLEKATAAYEKAKARLEASKARYEADLKRFKTAELDKTEAENLEIVRIVRTMDVGIPDLKEFKEKMKTTLPGRTAIQKEDEDRHDESGKNEEAKTVGEGENEFDGTGRKQDA